MGLGGTQGVPFFIIFSFFIFSSPRASLVAYLQEKFSCVNIIESVNGTGFWNWTTQNILKSIYFLVKYTLRYTCGMINLYVKLIIE